MYKKNKGFTIVELIVVMAIIAILVLMAVPTMQKYIKNAKLTAVLATAETIYNAAIAYEADNITDPNLLTTRHAGYIKPYTGSMYGDTSILIAESYLSPYIDGDVSFLEMYVPESINDTEEYNIFYAGSIRATTQTLKDPIVVYYNDPRLPTRMDIMNDFKLSKFMYTSTGILGGEPMVFGSLLTSQDLNNPHGMIPVSKYLEEYNKALKETN